MAQVVECETSSPEGRGFRALLFFLLSVTLEIILPETMKNITWLSCTVDTNDLAKRSGIVPRLPKYRVRILLLIKNFVT